MNAFLADLRPLLEVLSFVATIALTVGLAVAFKQLSLLREESIARSKRVAADKAIEASDMYLMSYVPLSRKFYDDKVSNKLSGFDGEHGDFSFASLAPDARKLGLERFKLRSWLPAMNCLESIAARFTTGVADEKVGFSIIGRTFCETVEDNYDLVAMCRMGEPIGYWSNIVSLYRVWRPRISEAELIHVRKELDGQLSTVKTSSIEPLK